MSIAHEFSIHYIRWRCQEKNDADCIIPAKKETAFSAVSSDTFCVDQAAVVSVVSAPGAVSTITSDSVVTVMVSFSMT